MENPRPFSSGIEHIKKRPGMYWGGRGKYALHELIWRWVELILKEMKKDGRDAEFQVTLLDAHTVILSDNLLEMPTKFDERSGKYLAELCFSESFCPGTIFSHTCVAINGASKRLDVEIKNDGFVWQQSFEEGYPISEFTKVGELDDPEAHGIRLTLTPNFDVFETNDFDYDWLYARFRQIAWGSMGLTIRLEDKRVNSTKSPITFYHENGLLNLLQYFNRDFEVLHVPIVAEKSFEDGILRKIGFAFQYTTASTSAIEVFGLDINDGVFDHTSHNIDEYQMIAGQLVRSLWASQLRVDIQSWYPITAHQSSDLSRGLSAIISFRLDKDVWLSWDGRDKIASQILDEFNKFFQETIRDYVVDKPEIARIISNHWLDNRALREMRLLGTTL